MLNVYTHTHTLIQSSIVYLFTNDILKIFKALKHKKNKQNKRKENYKLVKKKRRRRENSKVCSFENFQFVSLFVVVLLPSLSLSRCLFYNILNFES